MPKLGFLPLFIPLSTSLSDIVFHRDAKCVPEEVHVIGCCLTQFGFAHPSPHHVFIKRLPFDNVWKIPGQLQLCPTALRVFESAMALRNSKSLKLEDAASCSPRHKNCL